MLLAAHNLLCDCLLLATCSQLSTGLSLKIENGLSEVLEQG